MLGPHVDDQKGEKAMVYKARKGEEKEDHIFRACPKRLIARFHDRILNLFTLKSNIFGPRSD